MMKGLIAGRLLSRFLLAIVLALLNVRGAVGLPIAGTIDARAITVRPVGSAPQSDAKIGDDIGYADAIFDQIGIAVRLSSSAFLERDSANAGNPGLWTTAEFNAGLRALSPPRAVGNQIHLYYVPELAGARGFTVSQEDDPTNPGIIIRSERGTSTMAHEVGHILLDEWRWRAEEQFAAGGIHSKFGNDLMADGNVPINHPPSLLDVFPTGVNSEIRPSIGTLNVNGVATTDTIPQTNAMYFQNSFVHGLLQDSIRVNIEELDSGFFGWGTQQTISGIRVNEAARKIAKHKEEVTFHFRSLTGFPSGIGGIDQLFDIFLSDLQSVDLPYGSIDLDSLLLQTADDILANPAPLTTLVAGTDYNGSLIFDDSTRKASAGVTIEDTVLTGKHDVFLRFTLNTVPEPASLALLGLGLVGLALSRRKQA